MEGKRIGIGSPAGTERTSNRGGDAAAHGAC
jgi:hypothetical protein